MLGITQKRVLVYCGSSNGTHPIFARSARRLGRLCAQRGLEVIYGGGGVGLMKELADGAIGAGGRVTGVIPEWMVKKGWQHPRVRLRIVQDMAQRKQKMLSLAGSVIVLPGGLGTMEEFFETWTGLQLGLHRKPVGILNVGGFYNTLLEAVFEMQRNGFLKAEHRELLVVGKDEKRLLDRVLAKKYEVVPVKLPTLTR